MRVNISLDSICKQTVKAYRRFTLFLHSPYTNIWRAVAYLGIMFIVLGNKILSADDAKTFLLLQNDCSLFQIF